MIRVVVFLVLVGFLALGAAWLADRPGEVTIIWRGLRIDTSVLVAAAAVALVAALAVALWSLLRTALDAPGRIARARRSRRRSRGYGAISKGLIAVGAGDGRAARRCAVEAERIAPQEPLALLLKAQNAQLAGDRAGAERAFRDMAARADTRLLGLRGLFVEAQRRDDAAAARHYAEEAAKASPALAWAGQAVLEFRCASADWAGALATLERNRRGGLVDKFTYRRQRAVLLTARALALADSDSVEARMLVLEAVKLAPDLTPAAALAGRLLADGGEWRRAARIIETAWRANPHPDLADIYTHLKSGDSARDRLARIQALARAPAAHIEGALAVARAALDAQEFATARAALGPFLSAPTQRVATLMAEIEEAEHGDEGRAREWMSRALRARRDPVWTADGFISDQWMPVSPVSGRLDAFQWKVPVAEVSAEAPLIEEAASAPRIEAAAAARGGEPAPPAAPPPPGGMSGDGASIGEKGAAGAAGAARTAPRPRVEAVIPLVHAPDDPGPEPETRAAPASGGWRRLRLFFG